MPKNDFRSYQNAVNEYRQNDEELMHWRTKGSKNGVSTTPGYKAIGEKAKGLLNAAGQYIYDAGKSVGNAVSSVAKKAVSTLTPAQVKAQKSATVKNTAFGRTTGSITRANENAVAKDKQISSDRRETGSITRGKENAAIENNMRNQDMNSFAAKFKGQQTSRVLDEKEQAEMDKRLTAQKNAQNEAMEKGYTAAQKPYKDAIANAGADIINQGEAVINVAAKEDPEIENKVDQALVKAYKKYGVSAQDFQEYGMTEANRKNLAKELVKCSSASEVLDAYERVCDKMAKEALYKKNQQKKTSTPQTKKTVDNEYERESGYNSKKNKY